ncbi:MAG: PKD domain-containing protein [Planctomycetes bacterium]|nr:PKD domain-containing protein [Planctomycetota bacterium]
MAFTALLSGCSQLLDPKVTEPIQRVVEPEFGDRYWLYRPASYDREQYWPLIVVCHGGFPDSPTQQIRAWTELAESRGFVVAAPQLRSPGGASLSAAGRLERLRDDEQRIVATVQHVRAGHSISDDRIFLYGWAGGAGPALFTGLRNADVFRALAVMTPRLREGDLAEAVLNVDPYQPVYLHYAIDDRIRGGHGRHCGDTLREHGVDVRRDAEGSARRTDCKDAASFFELVIRKEPWLRIEAARTTPDKPLERRFRLHTARPPRAYRWEFGDGDESPVAEPVHAYAKPGTYRATVSVEGPQGRQVQRTLEVRVP